METKSLIAEIESVVNEINAEISEIVNNDSFMDEFPLEVECITNGRSAAIMFLGFRIWSSDDDERLFVANTKEESREPIKIYITNELNKIIKQISLIGNLSAS